MFTRLRGSNKKDRMKERKHTTDMEAYW